MGRGVRQLSWHAVPVNATGVLLLGPQEVDVCEDGRPLQEVWMVLEFCNRGTLSDAIQRGWLLTGGGWFVCC